jgi:anti-sigma factor RsiW
MSVDYLTCQELVELVTDYLEESLPAEERARFEEHVMTCPPCRAHIDQMRRTIQVVGGLTAEELPPKAEEDLLSAFRDWKRG